MPPPRTLAIITAAPHHDWDGRLWSNTPYVREINLWSHLFDRVIIVGPAETGRPGGDCIPFESDRIELWGVPSTGGHRLSEKLRQLLLLPLLVWRVARAVARADATHVRCPGNMGLLGVFIVPLLTTRMVAKYAGQWNGFPAEKWTVHLQRAVLASRWWRGPVTVYGEWPDQPDHVVPFFTSVLSEEQIEAARRVERPARAAGRLRLLYVGRLSGPKNVDALIRATAALADRGVDVQATIVGDGDERDHLEQLTRELGVADRVVFTGAVGIDAVLHHYQQADTLVLVSQSEGWPKAIAEAMTFGLVCVGSATGMVPQMLGDGRGRCVPPGDHVALTEVLDELAGDPAGADADAERAAAWGRRHSIERLETAIADLLTDWWGVPVGRTDRVSVLHVTDTLAAGGAERVAVNLANAMSRQRFRVAVCTTRRDGILAEQISGDVGRLRLHRTTRSRDPIAVLRLARYLRRERVDIVHAHGTSLFLSALSACLAPDTRLVWHDHLGANVDSRRGRRALYRLAASRAAHVITVSHELEWWAVTALGVDADRVTTVPNFVVSEVHDVPAELPGRAGARVVCVANLRPEKNHLGLVDAMASVVREVPEAHAILVGDQPDPALHRDVEARIAERGLEASVTLLGPRTDVDAILAACDVGVLSSTSEGFPLALLEYGRRGLPTVATTVGECPEILDHGDAGVLVSPNDPAALAAGVVDLLRRPDLATSLGGKLRRRIEAYYSAGAVVSRIEELYLSLAAAPRQPTST